LPTEVYIPEGPGPFPLIIHAHGSSGDPSKFSDLLTSWATHGYVVAAPTFPLTNDTTGGPTVDGDYVNQPADVRFVIDQLLGEAATHGTDLTGKIDARHIGVSGLSLGGTTVYGLLYNACCRDDRIRAAIVMSGIQLPFGSRPFTYRSVPLLIFHGTADTTIPYAAAVGQYASAVAPKYFVSLIGGRHSPPYENTPDVHDDVVMRVTLDFWNAYLRDDHAALLRIATDANVPRLSSIRFDR
jgi:predicted dienelactone hydrolase